MLHAISRKNWIAVPESKQSESHYEKPRFFAWRYKYLITVQKYREDGYLIVYLDKT